MYPHFGRIYSEMGKENKLTCRNCIIYLFINLFIPKKKETRWKQSLALNNEMRMNEMKMKPCI